ncbi:hypothetical protein BCR32DRAFT_325928 [Anaeromyces robustus]|uniref:Uncharacterized protein n=1 Tax=Anaeromyces robustus TaxID=1754192 RepID=A0A1Y1XFA7_9FUNG|nr:hypothetical protein BCR32DRAFT_325928 [Anaeromyces robustus]|eukprot:ORX84438.1 hypothetical protein BCR32DRAFT_325928 [Anaeromyces robustus]
MNEIIKKVRVNESFLRKTDTSCGSTTADTVKTRVSGISSRSNASNKNSIYSKILDYHYTTSVS